MLGRWPNRDDEESFSEPNLFSFVNNQTTNGKDLFGRASVYKFQDNGWSYEYDLWTGIYIDYEFLGEIRTKLVRHQYGITRSIPKIGWQCLCPSVGCSGPKISFSIVVQTESFILDPSHKAWSLGRYFKDQKVNNAWPSSKVSKRIKLTKEHEVKHRNHAKKSYEKAKRYLKKAERTRFESLSDCNDLGSLFVEMATYLYMHNEAIEHSKLD